MIKNKSLFNNFIWNAIGTSIVSFNSLFFLICVKRINGLEEAGIFSVTYATASILYIFAIYSGRSLQVTDIKGENGDKDYIVSRTTIHIKILFLYY